MEAGHCGLATKADIQTMRVKWHWHQLRHTFACNWLRDGGSIEALSRFLGHASVTTTERYAKLNESSIREEFRRVKMPKLGQLWDNAALTPLGP